jgi:hypothetical protein
MKSVSKLHLDKLKGGISGISRTYGAFLAEAIVVCLTSSGHDSGVKLTVEGDFKAEFELEWQEKIGTTELSSWRDVKEATEYAAMGIAILLISALTTYSVFQRNEQDEDADFTIQEARDSNIFSDDNRQKAHLEVSGIFVESPTYTLNMRISAKTKGLEKRTMPSLPVFIAVIEFNIPKAKIVEI